VRLGELFASWVEDAAHLELAAPAPLGLVCFRCRPRPGEDPADTDDRTRELMERINAPGDFFLTHTVLGGRYTIRLALGHLSTTEALIRQLWKRVAAD
jgi:aromatic-L-amino-acid decarboxylase